MWSTTKTSLVLLATLAITLVACNASPQPSTPEATQVVIAEPPFPLTPASSLPRDEQGVPRVSVEEALTAAAAGTAIIVDVRTPDAYALSHIQGAINIPLGTIENETNTIDIAKNQWIITYCT